MVAQINRKSTLTRRSLPIGRYSRSCNTRRSLVCSSSGISPAAYHLLIRFRWPGNVRELENAIERAVLVAKSADVQPQDLPDSIRGDAVTEDAFTVPPHHTLAEIERMAVVQTLQRTNWNKQEAAQILGLYRPTLYSKIKKHHIKDPRAQVRVAENEA